MSEANYGLRKGAFPFPDLNATWLVEMSDKAQKVSELPEIQLKPDDLERFARLFACAVVENAQAVASAGFETLFTVFRICETIW